MDERQSLPDTVYFHGQPGGPNEWLACAPRGRTAYAPDRNHPMDTSEQLAPIAAHTGHQPLKLIGFSLGVPAALAVARLLGERVAHVHLASPAGPLALGDFLPAMAGGPLFRLAREHPAVFQLVARLRSWTARHAPGFLLDRLFACAAGKDRALADTPAFRQMMMRVLREGLGRTSAGFEADIIAYVGASETTQAPLQAPVTIWQGDTHNWTPPAMAQALAAALPGKVTLHLLPGCSHYSTLQAALARL
jgi:pimeloyl-ACP methyl ester carboxylesterase